MNERITWAIRKYLGGERIRKYFEMNENKNTIL